MSTKKLVAAVAAAAILVLSAGTVVAAQQNTSPDQKGGPAATGAASTTQENEVAGGAENEAGEGNDSDESLSGSPAQKAGQVATRATDGGTVLEVEHGDDPNSAYEVEVRKDGSVTEVMLDSNFNVIDQTSGD